MTDLGNLIQDGETILIVDDNPVNLAVVVENLEQHGYSVLVALGGEEALKRAAFAGPDLILLDVMMPGLDGFETCRRLRSNPVTWDIPVIFMTALGDIRDKIAAFDAGAVDFVTKPFQVEEVLARVGTHLALRAAKRRLALQNEALEQEIVARRRTETELGKSEERYRRLFETAGDGILLIDPATLRMTDANRRFLELLGKPSDAVRNRRIGEFPWLNDAVGRAVSKLRPGDSLQLADCEIPNKDGTSLSLDITATACEAQEGVLVQLNLRDISERKKADAQIRYLALHDSLTGLANRTMFYERLSVEMATARRKGGTVALLALDLDHFKQVNDSLGHLMGDQLLEEAAQRIVACLRECDLAARLGGDEFAIALSEVRSREHAEDVASRILAALHRPFELGGHLAHVSGSIGVALFPADGDSPGTLMRSADTAMYGAKKCGRNAYRSYSHDLNVPGERWSTLSQEIHGARSRGELEIYYQPQTRLECGEIIGLECLLRWNHPREGLISPVIFIPLLEERGLMVEVGNWVLRRACLQNAQWQAQGLPPVRIGVNLSAQQFYRSEIVESVRDALEASGLDPRWLELELTESLTLDDSESTVRIMQELKALGVALSLDDFGTGWSSLSYLRRFPLDRIKIDRTFVRDMGSHDGTAAIVESILNLASTLGMDCIAEGVETQEQRESLLRQNCPNMQGFLFSEPVPAADIPGLLCQKRDGSLIWLQSGGTLSEPVS
jgi:diguanylate cyclase (GGDEF)-like protein/PAS domain S-box-containing protein